MLVWQSERRIELHQRSAANTWDYSDARAGDHVTIVSLDASLAVDGIYTDAVGG